MKKFAVLMSLLLVFALAGLVSAQETATEGDTAQATEQAAPATTTDEAQTEPAVEAAPAEQTTETTAAAEPATETTAAAEPVTEESAQSEPMTAETETTEAAPAEGDINELPRTASPLPLILVLGGLGVLAAVVVRRTRQS